MFRWSSENELLLLQDIFSLASSAEKFSLKKPQFSQILAMKLGRAVQFPEAKRTEIRPDI